DFFTLDNDRVYNLSLSLVRDTIETAGDTITATLTIEDVETGVTHQLSGTEDLEDATSGGVPIPGTGGPQSDSWDYFALRNATSGPSEFDFLLDNFMVEIFGSNEGGDLCPGDANGDGSVDLLDLDILGSNFGIASGATFAQGDFNEDGAVDLLDLDILGSNFGTTKSSIATPEPTSIAIVILAGLGACVRRRIA
ncbi:MAG: dockerin type I domain-containing protein, partial [Planctomycetota bacterium]